MAQQRMLGFVHTDRETPDKREAEDRRRDFDEIYREFAADKAREQANRCSQCGVPFCTVHCPVGNNIPDWLKLTAEGRLEEAYEISQATNNLPEICGRICPQDRLCEGACVIEQSGHGTVTIGSIERYINETAWERGWVKPVRPVTVRGQSVGIIGSGPAGLAAAEQLRQLGYDVTIYERADRAGGLLVYGIPGFKLEKHVVQRRVDLIAAAGVRFELNAAIDTPEAFAELRARHDALLIATGVYKARAMRAPGDDLAGIVPALDYLIASNRKGLGDDVAAYDDGTLNAAGKRVVVIGGGDTAMDCMRTALRQGAAEVHCIYRRDRLNMPGSKREVGHAEEEGGSFLWQAVPEGFGGGEGRVASLSAARMHLGVADASGRQTPVPIPGSGFELGADLVIMALGFEPEPLPQLWGQPELAVSAGGTVTVNRKTQMTHLPGVFAAGDIARGASLVVWAIRDGRDAAEGIHSYLLAKAAETVAAAAAE